MVFAYLIAAIIIAAAVATGAVTYSIHRRLQTASRDAALNARALYEQGKQEAEEDEESSGRLRLIFREAGIETSPVVWVASIAAIAIVVAVFASFVGGLFVAIVAAIAVLFVAALYISRGIKKRQEAFAEQFVRMLPQLSASVKSSLTLERSIRVSTDHAPEPLRSELTHILAQTTYGTPLPDALEALAKRTNCRDALSLAAALRVQSRFGGPIAAVLDSISDHANARMRLERELRTELAGTRLAQWFVACSMPAIFLLSYATNADFATFYREDPLGWLLLACALVMEIIGVMACRHVTKCKRAQI